MQIVPLQAVPSQVLSIGLNNQQCSISVYQRGAAGSVAVYLDLYLSGALVVGGVQGRNGVRIVRDAYFGFSGDLAFYDTQGADDPLYTGLGARWQLVYLAPTDLAEASV